MRESEQRDATFSRDELKTRPVQLLSRSVVFWQSHDLILQLNSKCVKRAESLQCVSKVEMKHNDICVCLSVCICVCLCECVPFTKNL